MNIWIAGKEDIFKGTDYLNVNYCDFIDSTKFQDSDVVIFVNAGIAVLVKSRDGLTLKEILMKGLAEM